MKSNVCVIRKGGLGIETILREVEKIADCNGLQKKETLRLRLLAEELTGMLPALLENFDGYFWLENSENKYELHTEISVDSLSTEKKQELIDMSAKKKNAAASGFMGKIRDIAETMLLYSDESSKYYYIGAGYLYDCHIAGNFYSHIWTLDNYIDQKKEAQDNNAEEWDQLEKSIVAKLADDVIVGIKGRKVEIVIKKNF